MNELPGALGVTSTFPFVGRSAELERLRTLLPRADGEERRIVLLGGEAGSGKSRLAREFAAEAADAGVLVLYGAADAVVRTPVRAVRRGARPAGPHARRRRAARGAPRRSGRAGPPAPRPRPAPRRRRDADPDTERHRLHTAVADLLTGVTRRRAALLVLEDGHWADAATLLLLRHLARASGPRAAAAGDVPRHRGRRPRRAGRDAGRPAPLRRHADAAVRALARRGGRFRPPRGRRPGRRRARARRCTPHRGQRLPAVRAVAGADRDGGDRARRRRDPDPSPARGARQPGERARGRQPAPVPAGAARPSDLLELAATAGTEFELDVVRRAAGLGDAELLQALDEAFRSGMIDEVPGRGLVWRFAHELVRRALYDRLSGPRRAELHLRVGEALEGGGRRSGRALADLAHHFAAAAPFGPPRPRRRVQRAGGARGQRRAGVRRGRGAPAHRDRARPATRGRSTCSSWARPSHRGGPRAGGAGGVPGGRGDRPRARRSPSCWPEPRSATRRRAGART